MFKFRIFSGAMLLVVGVWQGGIFASVDLNDTNSSLEQGITTANDLIRLGHAYLDSGDKKQAQKTFQQAIKKGAKAASYDGLGLICSLTRGKGLRAQYWFRRALSADPNFADAQYHLAQIYLKMRPSDALPAFEKVVGINPNHPNAHFAIGQLLEKRNSLDWAITAYRKQIEVTSDHHQSQHKLGKLLLKRQQTPEAVLIFKHLTTVGGNYQAQAYLELAKLSQLSGQIPTAQKLFEAHINSLPTNEQPLFHDITHIASKDELALYNTVPQNQQADQIRRFWRRADPTPLTVENERLIEHYRRVAYARTHYSKGQFPWDDRGDVYVRLGSPNHISRSDNVQATFDRTVQNVREQFVLQYQTNNSITPGQPLFATASQWEYWIYAHIAGGAEIAFVTEFSDGQYKFAPISDNHTMAETMNLLTAHGDILVQNIAAQTPSIYTPQFADLPLEFHLYPAGYRGENGNTRLEIYYGLSASEAVRLSTVGETNTIQLERGIAVYDSLWNEVYITHDNMIFEMPTEKDIINGAFLPGILPIDLAPGTYRTRFQIRDTTTGKSRVYQQDITLDNYQKDQLQLSDIELAFSILPTQKTGPFVKNGLSIIPKSSRTFRQGQHAFVYFETYHLQQNEFGQKRYQISYTVRPHKDRAIAGKLLHGLSRALRLGQKDEEITVTYEQIGSGTEEVAYTELNLDAHGSGQYQIEVTVIDLITEQKVSKDLVFQITP